MNTEVMKSLYRKFRDLKSQASSLGGREVSCPSCHVDTAIEELDTCECGQLCCTDCRTIGEDCTICSACLKSLIDSDIRNFHTVE